MATGSPVAVALAALNISAHAGICLSADITATPSVTKRRICSLRSPIAVGGLNLDGQTLVQSVLASDQATPAFDERQTAKDRNQHASLRHLLLGVTTGVQDIYSHDVPSEVSREEAAMWLALLGRLHDQIEQLQNVS